ncbi:hypothetical protein CR513_52620, partial [Mucuna pruriens]
MGYRAMRVVAKGFTQVERDWFQQGVIILIYMWGGSYKVVWKNTSSCFFEMSWDSTSMDG